MGDASSRDPKPINRRQFVAAAALLSASAAWASVPFQRSNRAWRERRDLFPEGVASGDPDASSVLLWTRRPVSGKTSARLWVEVAEDETFEQVIVETIVKIDAASDWTCRVLVGNLAPSRVYWYRFIDAQGNASRPGRTITAPALDDRSPVRFAFVSCQNANLGALHAWRRMIFEDERADVHDRLGFVLHLGDFIYETVWYPEDNPQGVWGRQVREFSRYPQGRKIGDFHVPVCLEDYRTAYRAYLHDPDLQDARARWPFVCIWDNHEFSAYGWQSFQTFDGRHRPSQTLKVAANQAWFEYQPARVKSASGALLQSFTPPPVRDAPVTRFDEHGLGDEPNNLSALASLTGYRALRWGANIELLITDQRSYRSEDPLGRPEAASFLTKDFPTLFPQEVIEILDAGQAYAGGNPPETIHFDGREVPNFRRNDPPQTILGIEQKRWFLQRLKESDATWKIWGNSLGTLEYRIDPRNLPSGLTRDWPGSGYAAHYPTSDFSTAYMERAEIYKTIRDEHITGFVTVSGDRHSFWAGLASPALPPKPFDPVGVAFITGSISTPGLLEIAARSFPPQNPLSALYVNARANPESPDPMGNLLLRRGVRSCLEYQHTRDTKRADRLSNESLSPHLSFVDLDGHGYSVVRVASDALECEFVAIPRPTERSTAPDGGPLLYRVIHRAALWSRNEAPSLQQRVVSGDPTLSL